jgi:hypothetical protein
MVIFLIISGLGVWTLEQAKKGITKEVRILAGMEGLKEAVARCVEQDRPIFFTTGHGGGGLYTDNGPAHMAGVGILGFVARQCARLGAKIVSCWPFPEMLPVAEDVIYQAYLMEGRPEEYPTDSARYLSSYALAFKIGYIGQLTRENAGATVITGAIWASDALQMTEPGVMMGAIQVGGAVAMSSLSMLALTCDYTFIGEELFSAGAFASEDPTQLGVMYASDIVKLGLIAIIFLGIILGTVGINISQILTI